MSEPTFDAFVFVIFELQILCLEPMSLSGLYFANAVIHFQPTHAPISALVFDLAMMERITPEAHLMRYQPFVIGKKRVLEKANRL